MCFAIQSINYAVIHYYKTKNIKPGLYINEMIFYLLIFLRAPQYVWKYIISEKGSQMSCPNKQFIGNWFIIGVGNLVFN